MKSLLFICLLDKKVLKHFICVQLGDCRVDSCHVSVHIVRCICCPPQVQFVTAFVGSISSLEVNFQLVLHVTSFPMLHSAVGDACVAMDEWVQNPEPHTAFDDILPCVDNATAQEAALRTKDATFQLVTVVNHVITNASNVDNQSDRSVPLLCNPFHSNLVDRHCISGEVPLQNATQVTQII